MANFFRSSSVKTLPGSINRYYSQLTLSPSIYSFRLQPIICQRYASSERETPIQFSGSKAATWVTSEGFAPPALNMPKIQPFSVLLSLTIFLIYFCVIREENDLDEELNTSLYQRYGILNKKD